MSFNHAKAECQPLPDQADCLHIPLTMDRLAWPEGTVLFELAAAEAHTFAKQKLLQCKARVPRGSLLRRVNADIQVWTLHRSPAHRLAGT